MSLADNRHESNIEFFDSNLQHLVECVTFYIPSNRVYQI